MLYNNNDNNNNNNNNNSVNFMAMSYKDGWTVHTISHSYGNTDTQFLQRKHNVIGVQKVLVSFLYSVRSALVFQMINLSSYKRQRTKIKYNDRILQNL